MTGETTAGSEKEDSETILDHPVKEGCSYSNPQPSDRDELEHMLNEETGETM